MEVNKSVVVLFSSVILSLNDYYRMNMAAKSHGRWAAECQPHFT